MSNVSIILHSIIVTIMIIEHVYILLIAVFGTTRACPIIVVFFFFLIGV